MGDDITIEEQALEFAVAPPAMEGDAVERRQSMGIARAGFRQHGLAREQAADDPYHRRGRRAGAFGCAAGGRGQSGFWGGGAVAAGGGGAGPRPPADSGRAAPPARRGRPGPLGPPPPPLVGGEPDVGAGGGPPRARGVAPARNRRTQKRAPAGAEYLQIDLL